MLESQIKIGQRVKTTRGFYELEEGSEGIIIEDYGRGIMVAWDLPHRPYPRNRTPEEMSKMMAIHPDCPLRDGFDKDKELEYLEIVT